MINITNRLPLEGLSANEVSILLSKVVQGASICRENPNTVIFAANALTVLFNKTGTKILEVKADNDFWKKNRTTLLDLFQNASSPNEYKTYDRIVFCSGEELSIPPFRWKDEFQLGRIPDGNPKIDGPCPRHPCLFQFKAPVTGNLTLDSHRAQHAFKRFFFPLAPLLHQFCMTSLECDVDPTIHQDWVLLDTGSGYQSRWGQIDYLPTTDLNTGSWHDYRNPDVTLLPTKGTDLHWLSASDLSSGYLAYEQLSEDDQELFLLGCEWFIKSVTARSSTDRFLFMMIMLEIFLPNTSESCNECGQPKFSVNQRFKTYIQDTIGENWTDDFSKVLGRLYTLRSSISHRGAAIAQHSFGLNPTACREDSQVRYLTSLGRQFLVSWLMKKTTRCSN